MPKISAPTIAEHRAAQRAALMAAASALISEQGVTAVTPRSVGERAGLARSSFYDYFPSRDDLLAAIAIQAFEQWTAELDAAMAAVPPGRARLHAYVEATIRMTADGKHDLATELQQAELSPKSFDAVMEMHHTLTTPLQNVLLELGVREDSALPTLVRGVISAGMQLVAHGATVDATVASITALLDRGISPEL
ncbi:MAG: TetR/AcrR family transcriptional regulator [Protaetiibacter sp.]